ncbi:MAG TPA: lysylphosphatidylglycerol synthase transmembrane domain-containing protein [Chloroflexota bacterium]|nr:lysylphosphatidylglycerol synthase transmembrane domain-containing protein [Chloroflexota bacterium]
MSGCEPKTLTPRAKPAAASPDRASTLGKRAVPAIGTAALLIGVVTLAIGASGGAGALWVVLTNNTLDPRSLLPILPIAAWGYGLRFARWHILIRRAVPELSVPASLQAQVTGYGLVATPGRLGEVWKLYVVERATGVPVARGAGAMVVERVTDVLGFGGLAAVSAIVVSGQVAERPLIVVLLGGVGLVVALAARPLVVRKLATTRLGALVAGGDAVFRPAPVAQALALIVIGRIGDSLMLFGIVAALGYPVTIWHAMLILGSSGLIGGISLLPAGIGAVEAASVAIFVAAGVPAATGLAAILLTRVLTIWFWVAVGLVFFAVDHVRQIRGTARLRA